MTAAEWTDFLRGTNIQTIEVVWLVLVLGGIAAQLALLVDVLDCNREVAKEDEAAAYVQRIYRRQAAGHLLVKLTGLLFVLGMMTLPARDITIMDSPQSVLVAVTLTVILGGPGLMGWGLWFERRRARVAVPPPQPHPVVHLEG